jgi:hypothetical protein
MRVDAEHIVWPVLRVREDGRVDLVDDVKVTVRVLLNFQSDL